MNTAVDFFDLFGICKDEISMLGENVTTIIGLHLQSNNDPK